VTASLYIWASFALVVLLGWRAMSLERRLRALAAPLHELRGAIGALDLGLLVVERRSRSEGDVARGLSGFAAPIARAESAIVELDATLGRRPTLTEASRHGALDLRALVLGAASAWSELAPAYGASFEVDWRAGEVVLLGEPAVIGRALDNVIANALEHGGGMVLVESWRRARSVIVTVSDGGPGPRGIPAARCARGFGRGRGLVIARSALERLGGSLLLARGRNGPGLRLELPVSEAAARGAPGAGQVRRENGARPSRGTREGSSAA
jgi:signal transduction histidine kinase